MRCSFAMRLGCARINAELEIPSPIGVHEPVSRPMISVSRRYPPPIWPATLSAREVLLACLPAPRSAQTSSTSEPAVYATPTCHTAVREDCNELRDIVDKGLSSGYFLTTRNLLRAPPEEPIELAVHIHKRYVAGLLVEYMRSLAAVSC